MINVQATDMVDLDVFINIFAFIEVDSIVCKIYFHHYRFLQEESKVDLKKCIALQIWRETNIQYDLAKYVNYTHKS